MTGPDTVDGIAPAGQPGASWWQRAGAGQARWRAVDRRRASRALSARMTSFASAAASTTRSANRPCEQAQPGSSTRPASSWCALSGATCTASRAARRWSLRPRPKAMLEGVGMVSTLMLKDSSDRTAFKVFEPGGTAATAGLRIRQQPAAAGRPGKLQATALDAGHRLGARPALVPGRHSRWNWTRAGSCSARWRGWPRPGFAMKCGLEIEFHIYRITDDAGPARPAAGGLARPAARGQPDPPGLQPAGRSLVRHGRGAAAHRAAHGAGPGPAPAVAGDRTGSQPGGSGVRRHRCPDRGRQHGAVPQCREAGAAPRRLPRHLHVPAALPQHHVQRLAPAPIAGATCAPAQRLSCATRLRPDRTPDDAQLHPVRSWASTTWPDCWSTRAAWPCSARPRSTASAASARTRWRRSRCSGAATTAAPCCA